MNIQPYRSSFTVFVADSLLERGREITSQLGLAGYACEHRLSLESLNEEILRNPPHILIFQFTDVHFFANAEAYRTVIENMRHRLPEVQIFFLCQHSDLAQCCDLMEYGVYDCISWPLEHQSQLLRAVDRAAEANYYMYLNEQLKERLDNQSGASAVDLALFEVWLKEVDHAQTLEELIELFLREATRYLKSNDGIYFKFRELQKTLVATQAVGLTRDDIAGVGLDLNAAEPGFVSAMLLHPEKVQALHDFVHKGLLRQQALFFSLVIDEKIEGIFLLPTKKDQVFRDDMNSDGYLSSCLQAVRRQIRVLTLNEKLKRLSIFDSESEALHHEIMLRKLKEEVSRARRIGRPVSLILISLDGYTDLSLSLSRDMAAQFLKSISDLLQKNSRLNDLVGRMGLDQFAVCLPHTEKRGAAVKAERFRRMLETADFTSVLGQKTKITISAGVSEYPSNCHDAEDLVKSAEQAMLEVRRAGNNRVAMAVAPLRFVPDFVVKDGKTVSPFGS